MSAALALGGLAARTAHALAQAVVGPRLSIINFHRVCPKVDPLFPEELTAERFDRMLSMLRRSAQVLPLSEALLRLRDRSLPPGAVVITFDDGYADNAEVALPILQRHRLPATFYVATGFVDGGRMFNDTVIESIRCCALDEVSLDEFGLPRLSLRTAADRRQAINALLPRVKYLGLVERETALALLHRLLGSPALPGDLMMRRDQVLRLQRAGMEVGGHTVHHPILRLLDDEASLAELTQCRAELEAWLQAPVRHFAYPNGRLGDDFDSRHAALVARAGYETAVTTMPGTVTAASDPYRLPRFTPWDASALRWWLRLFRMRLRAA
ncbi:MAG: polysaccharide deacetylase family protein [Betaproteobacteria bacterium]|nr:polysaccharide deacetylase family protein [Rubrivivax sp.]MCZ8174286.1 polysaccharide deacetylase family protein [Burkholderiaceae bacterium]